MSRSPNSYAVLGLLRMRPWSPYELIGHMKRSTVRFVWPRAESKLYEEPKRLVELGWARAKPDPQRRRTSYAITKKGETALRQWLAEPGGAVTIESEAMLKVLFADAGTKADLLATIRCVRDEMLASQQAIMRQNAQQFVDQGPPFPERAHISALAAGFVGRVQDAVLDWADWAEARVRSWPDTSASPEGLDEAVAFARQWLADHPASAAPLHAPDVRRGARRRSNGGQGA